MRREGLREQKEGGKRVEEVDEWSGRAFSRDVLVRTKGERKQRHEGEKEIDERRERGEERLTKVLWQRAFSRDVFIRREGRKRTETRARRGRKRLTKVL
jgi:hypothetical protein